MKTFLLTQTKNLFVVFCCATFLAPAKSQTATFSLLPSNTQTMTLTCDSVATQNKTYISNPTANDIALSYSVKSSTLPSSTLWDYSFCNWHDCIPGLPMGTTAVSTKIPAHSQTMFITLDITNNKNKGYGSFVIRLFETGNPSNFQDITWNVYGCTAAGISENVRNTDFIVYPNPAQDFVNVEITTGYSKSGSIQVYNLVGEKLMELNGIKNSIQKIDLHALPAGAYFVKYSAGEGASVKKIFKTE